MTDFSRGEQRLLRMYITGDTLMHDGPLGQAGAAERAGFDLVCCSDHLAPWRDQVQG